MQSSTLRNTSAYIKTNVYKIALVVTHWVILENTSISTKMEIW